MATTADPVLVEFGAKIDELVNAVNQVKNKLGEVVDHAEGLNSGFKKLGEIITAAFSIEKISEFIESMADLGLKTERAMAQLGLSASQVGILSGEAKLAGTNLETITTAIERVALNVQRSTRDAFNPAAQALKNIGLSAKEMAALPVDQYMLRLAEAASKFNGGLALTTNLLAIGSRGMIALLPMLLQGAEHFKHFEAEIKATGSTLTDLQAKTFAQTHEKLTLLGAAFQGLGIKIFDIARPAIDIAADSLRKFIQNLDPGSISSAMYTVANALLTFGQKVSVFFSDALLLAEQAAIRFSYLAEYGFPKAFSPTNLAAMNKEIEALGTSAERVASITAKFDSWKNWLFWVKETSNYFKLIDEITTNISTKKNIGMPDFGAQKASTDRLKVVNDEYKLAEENIKRQYGDFIFYEDAKTAALLAALKTRYEEEIKAGENVKVAYAKMALDRQKILDAASKAYEASLNTAFGGLEAAINGQLRGLLAGTTKFKDAVKAVFGDMVIFAIQQMEKMGFQWLAHQIAMTMVTETQAGARATADQAASLSTLPARVARFTSDITADASRVFAGIFADLAPLMGPAAAVPAGAGQAATLAQLANAPKFDIGTDYVARTGFAMVHEGEQIKPAEGTGPFTGGGNISVAISAVDARSVENLLVGNKKIIGQIIQKLARDNPAVFNKRGAFPGIA